MSIILVHGLGQSASSWHLIMDRLDQQKNMLVPELTDLFGTNEKSYLELYKSFQLFCNSIEGEIHLCGLSLGAILSLNYTLDYPEKVGSLILIAGQYKMPKKMMKFQNFIFNLLPQKMFKEFNMEKKEVISFTKSMENINFEEQLGKINCPTLLICGEKDKANIKAGEFMGERIPKASFKKIPKASHAVNIEKPEELAFEINAFLTH